MSSEYESAMKLFHYYREWELHAVVAVASGDRNELSEHGITGLAKHLMRLLKETKRGQVNVAPLNFRSQSYCLSTQQTEWLTQWLNDQEEVADAMVVNANCLDIIFIKSCMYFET